MKWCKILGVTPEAPHSSLSAARPEDPSEEAAGEGRSCGAAREGGGAESLRDVMVLRERGESGERGRGRKKGRRVAAFARGSGVGDKQFDVKP